METTRQFIRGRAVSVGEGRTASSKSHNLIQLLRRECDGTNDRRHYEGFEKAAPHRMRFLSWLAVPPIPCDFRKLSLDPSFDGLLNHPAI